VTLKYILHTQWQVKNFRKGGPANLICCYHFMLTLFSDTTIIQRKKKLTRVSISDAEIELLLKGYQLHPCSWDRILNYVTERCEHLTDEALKYYRVATKKQL
jgi:hypothetical protein